MFSAQQIFVDDDVNIYILDDKGILYMHELYQMKPFQYFLEDIKNCFQIEDTYLVHTKNSLVCFDDEFQFLGVHEKLNYLVKKVICKDKFIYIITNNNEIIMSKGLSCHMEGLTFKMYQTRSYDGCQNVDVIADGNFIAIFYDGSVDLIQFTHTYAPDGIYQSSTESIVFTFAISYDEFKQIIQIMMIPYDPLLSFVDPFINLFILWLSNGDRLRIYQSRNHHTGTYNTIPYEEFEPQYHERKQPHMIVRDSADTTVLVLNVSKAFAAVIEKHQLFASTEFVKINIDRTELSGCSVPTDVQHCLRLEMKFLKQGGGVRIIHQAYYKRCIFLYQSVCVVINVELESLDMLPIDEDLIMYGYLIEKVTNLSLNPVATNTKKKLKIDINIGTPVLTQLLEVIPHIYRNNSKKIYSFEQVTDISVVSYGLGVTRQVFTTLSEELDQIIFKNGTGLSQALTKSNCINIGKLLYFCFSESNVKFHYVPPYLFYLIAKTFGMERNVSYLLTRFKKDIGGNLLQQYLKYKKDPSILTLLDLDLTSANDYIRYLFQSDLTPDEIIRLEACHQGFMFYVERNPYFHVLNRLHIRFWEEIFYDKDFLDISFDFQGHKNASLGSYLPYAKIFKEVYYGLLTTTEQKKIFCRNITGTQYYDGIITIIFDFDPKLIEGDESPVPVGHLSDENIIIDEDENPIDEDENPIDQLLTVLSAPSVPSLWYKISTCRAELTILVNPTVPNLSLILEYLTISDSVLHH